jgi:type IVB pilus formation R64 PilN family outer membrane protein
MNVSVGGSASGAGGSSSISMSSSITVETWSQFESTITSMVSSNSKIVVSPSDGTITLTATPTDIKRVAKYINEQNARLSRQVAISVRILQVSLSDKDKYGLDLKATFKDTITSIGATASQGLQSADAASTLTWGIVKGNWTADAIVQALSEKNRTSLVTSGTVTTLNNKPAPIQVTQKQNYISEMTKTNNGTDGDSYDISVTTAEIETGFTLDVLPRIMDHGRLMMLFSLSLSDLLSLESVYLDSSEESGYIQNPVIEERGFSQEVSLKSGETLILSGYERVETASQKEGLGAINNNLLGGNQSVEKTRSIVVILLTPVVLESPLLPESRMNY